MHLMHGWPNGNVNVFAGEVERLACHWHPVFPANQTTDAAKRRRLRFEARSVTLSPNDAFSVGGNEFSMVIHKFAVISKCEQRIEERPLPGPLSTFSLTPIMSVSFRSAA